VASGRASERERLENLPAGCQRKSLRHVITSINTIHSLLVRVLFLMRRAARPFDESQSSMLRQSEKIHTTLTVMARKKLPAKEKRASRLCADDDDPSSTLYNVNPRAPWLRKHP
jgi:hypothetical protein